MEKKTTLLGQIHYIGSGDGLAAIYVINAGVDTMYYVHTDHLGSYDVITNQSGAIVQNYSFDAWGRRRNPSNWTYNNLPIHSLFSRGYTSHEHLDAFNLINMNGRIYDPVIARFLSPDNFVQSPFNTQSYNRYSYCINDPLGHTDPSGNFFIIDSWLSGFCDGLNSTQKFSGAWREANKKAGNDAKIWGGLFAADTKQAGWFWQIPSRFTWQLPQTGLGFLWNQLNNSIGRVEDVEYFHGATYVVGAARGGNAVTLGSYISISPVREDDQANIRIGEGGYTTMHEYGHYLQSQKSGLLYLFKYGIPSAFGDADWTEIDANTRSAPYFHEIDLSFNWVQITGNRYRMLAERVYNPKWFEYPMFLTGIGIPIITAKNWSEPW